MLEPILAADAFAAAADAPAHTGQYPILEFFIGVTTLVVAALGTLFYRGAPASTPAAASAAPSAPDVPPGGAEAGVHLYFGGPLQKIFEQIVEVNKRLDQLIKLHGETREAMAEALRVTRHDIKAAIHQSGLETEEQIKAIGEIFGALNTLVVRLDEFARLSLKR